MSSIIEFKRPDGKTSKGYLTEGSKVAPAVVVIQEWWGMNDQIKKDLFKVINFLMKRPKLSIIILVLLVLSPLFINLK